MLKIRLKSVGRKHDRSFRVVVSENTRGVSSHDFVEIIGNYDPRRGVNTIQADRAKYWISKGAQYTDTVYNLLVDVKALEGRKRNVLPQKSPVIKAEK